MTTTNTAPGTRDTLTEQLEADGYTIGRPAHVRADCIAIDRQSATESSCDHCGHHGLDFLPFRPADPRQRGYRCIAWCSFCDAAVEF